MSADDKQATVLALRLFGGPGGRPRAGSHELLAAVAEARRALELAQHYFQCVTEPGLVDHAVLQLAAAERRYTHLLAEARREGLRLAWNDPPERRM